MNTKSTVTMSAPTAGATILSWLFGIAVLIAGLINTFWGNDTGFGIFLILLSFVYFPPLTAIFTSVTGFSIHWALKLLLALFIIWATIGVGEIFDKIELMMTDLG